MHATQYRGKYLKESLAADPFYAEALRGLEAALTKPKSDRKRAKEMASQALATASKPHQDKFEDEKLTVIEAYQRHLNILK